MTPNVQVLLGASGICAGAASGGAYYAVCGVRAQWFGATVWRGQPGSGSIALTFDDGPAEDTERVLETLAFFGVQATFFLIGRQVERYPHIARRVVAAGHAVGNHSYSHPFYLWTSRKETYRQLRWTQDIIADVTGIRPIWSRPPYGVRTPAYFAAARRLELTTIQWTVAGFDWKPQRSAAAISTSVMQRASAGSIVLLHDGDSARRQHRRETVAALPLIIRRTNARGLRVAPLTELIEHPVNRQPSQPSGTFLHG